MKAKDIRQKTQSELMEQLKAMKKELRELSYSVISKKEKNVKKPRNARKDLARILSVIKEKQILEGVQK
jgi:large subunit ribosomal protein L29